MVSGYKTRLSRRQHADEGAHQLVLSKADLMSVLQVTLSLLIYLYLTTYLPTHLPNFISTYLPTLVIWMVNGYQTVTADASTPIKLAIGLLQLL